MSRLLRYARCAACALALWYLLVCAVAGEAAAADGVMDFMEGGGGDDDNVDALLTELETVAPDYELLRTSHLSDVWRWSGVRPAAPTPQQQTNSYSWKIVNVGKVCEYANIAQGSGFPLRYFAQPETLDPIATEIKVPEEGTYRVWLSQAVEPGIANAVTLQFAGANQAQHTFGALVLPSKEGSQLEKQFPVRFESETARAMPFYDASVVWEYWDVTLKEGATTITLQPRTAALRLDSLFLSMSKVFVPRKGMDDDDQAINGNHFRYRVLDAGPGINGIQIKSFIYYNPYPHLERNFPNNIYYGSMGIISAAQGGDTLSPGEWSAWLNGTKPCTSGGQYSTDNLTVSTPGGTPLTAGFVEVQYAWYPDPGAVIRTLRLPIAKGMARYTFPATWHTYRSPLAGGDDAGGVWGMRDATYQGHFESEAEVLERILAYIDDAGLKAGPTPKRIKLYTGCRVSPALYDLALPRLKKLGINWVGGVPLDVCAKYDFSTDIFSGNGGPQVTTQTHDPLDPTLEIIMEEATRAAAAVQEAEDPDYRQRVKYFGMGDEIGPIVTPDFINLLPDCRAAWHDYLGRQLERMGAGPAFFGAKTLDEVDFLLNLPDAPGVYQRRVFYHSSVFNWLFTSRYYERLTRAVRKVFPDARTTCNYTPGSFMHGGSMVSSDWFALNREGGATLAWGEDWLGGNSRYAMAGIQTVSYYGAIVECAARARNLESGLYLVCATGSIDRKLLCLTARGLTLIHLYNWGPEYASCDSFSNIPWPYKEIGRGARALGPADEIIADGKRDPAAVALFYNRVNEYWRGPYAGEHFNRLLTFLALSHAHVPVDIILNEDLTPEKLEPYRVVYVQGLSMTRAGILALTDWVKAGGTLVADAGTAMYDEYNDPMPEAVVLFGAQQQIASLSPGPLHPIDVPDLPPLDSLTLSASELTPAITVPVVGLKTTLTPTTGKAIGAYANGTCGAVLNDLGRGKSPPQPVSRRSAWSMR